ncbi:hypothetical protein ACJRO7_003198 [Eucalyptus globulus]|uniref:Uncharacterized protein n=1 Tax=Eucalyptus globulus TaxID=34317 RepID=A0ABD3IVE1_EUCGL
MASSYFMIILLASIFYSIGDIEARRHGPSPPSSSVANGVSLVDFPSGLDPILVPVKNEELEPLPSDDVLSEVGLDPIPAPINNEKPEPLPSGHVLPEAGPDPIPALVNYKEPPAVPRA